MADAPRLGYASPNPRSRHSPYAIASVGVAIATVIWSLLDPWLDMHGIHLFGRNGSDTAFGIGMCASLLGMILAAAAWRDPVHKLILSRIGLYLNCVALLAVSVFLPTL